MPGPPDTKTLRSMPADASSRSSLDQGELVLAADQLRGRARDRRGRGIGQRTLAQAHRLGAGCDPEFLPESAVQPLELPDRRVPIAVSEVLAHQLDVGAFVGGIEFDQLTPAPIAAAAVRGAAGRGSHG